MTQPLDIINHLVGALGYRTYLEIGVRYRATIDRVAAPVKHSVDIRPECQPTFAMSSDAFFAADHGLQTYDCIYIDGDHRELPALRDTVHAVERLSHNGTIVCHDVLPANRASARPNVSGEAWKAFAYLRMSRPDLWMGTVNTPCGCGIVRRGRQELFRPDEADAPADYSFYARYRDRLMNVVTVGCFHEMVAAWAATTAGGA